MEPIDSIYAPKKKQLALEKEVLLLMSLKNKYEKLTVAIKEYSLKQLLEITAHLIDKRIGPSNYSKYDLEFIIEQLLSERVRMLHKDYDRIWTDEDKQRLSAINDEIFRACEKGFEEAFVTASLLEKRIKKRDSFLKDYEIEIKVTPYPTIQGVNRDVADTVCGFLGEESIPCAVEHISHCHFHRYNYDEFFLIDKNPSWNTDFYRRTFPGINICYLVHRMMESHVWSYPDILSIRNIWVDVQVTYQYYRNISKK